MPDITSRISSEICSILASEISAADGNEVFAVGNLDGSGIVTEIYVAARGNDYAAPVVQSAVDSAEVLIHNHPSGNLHPSDADLEVASQAAFSGLGFYIINNNATKIYVVVEPVLTRKKKCIDPDRAAILLSSEGPLSSFSDSYEERPSQMELASSCACAFNGGNTAMFEAGTGVGKSFAYLIPAVLWTIENKDRIVISTATINLQQQLMEKDIPLVQKIIGKEVKAVLVKGRRNYLCKRRFAAVIQERDFFDEDLETLDLISAWAENTTDGSRADLSFLPSENLWSRICSESDACMGRRCGYHTSCFVMTARKEAATASLLVVNHHLLFADIEARYASDKYTGTAVLPPFHHIIFDEAHAIENAATSFFSESVSRFKIMRQLSSFIPDKQGRRHGKLDILSGVTSDKTAAAEALHTASSVKKTIEELETATLTACGERYSFRISPGTVSSPDFQTVFSLLDKLKRQLVSFSSSMHFVFDGITGEDDLNNSTVWEAKIAVKRLEAYASLLNEFLSSFAQEDLENVFWIERNSFIQQRKKKGSGKVESACVIYPKFIRTPLSVAETMKNAVFDPFRTVVCVSATLRISSDFTFWMNRTGLSLVQKDRILSGVFDSPFPYSRNVLLALPDDGPLPEEKTFQAYIESAVPKLLEASSGAALVLFTSYESLRSCCREARIKLAGSGINILQQGEDDRARLLQSFRDDTSSVLFATDSFWEGVDAPGETLQHVIIVKLPFRVPDNPVFEARCEQIEKKGGIPFMELSLPDAVIKFRQGFGRLMRKKTDKGIITVLDKRVTVKRYGRVFLDSIPETRRVKGTMENVVTGIEDFLYS